MNKMLAFSAILAACLWTCKNDPKTASNTKDGNISQNASAEILSGHWIPADFCSRINQYGSVLEAGDVAHPPYCYAFTFNPGKPDSILCFNGFESWSLPVKYKVDTMEVVGAKNGKSIFLVYNSAGDKDITMFNSTGAQTRIDKFIKSNAGTQDGLMAFRVALNHNLLQGQYTQLGKGGEANVQFTPGGLLKGVKEFDHYELCFDGDCFIAGDKIDIITLRNARTPDATPVTYGLRFSAANDTLIFFNLVNKKPEEKGGYDIATPAYRFLRKK